MTTPRNIRADIEKRCALPLGRVIINDINDFITIDNNIKLEKTILFELKLKKKHSNERYFLTYFNKKCLKISSYNMNLGICVKINRTSPVIRTTNGVQFRLSHH